ncbi:MAG TPA: hypothetical protein VF268_02325, partial [Gammaproteobacteria bacterium]
MRILLSLVMMFSLSAACAANVPEVVKRKDERYVSIIELIANPEKFDGQYVSVGGYLTLSREYEHSLFLDENSYLSGMAANSIAVSFASSAVSIQKKAEELDNRYVSIAGLFKAGTTVFSYGEL